MVMVMNDIRNGNDTCVIRGLLIDELPRPLDNHGKDLNFNCRRISLLEFCRHPPFQMMRVNLYFRIEMKCEVFNRKSFVIVKYFIENLITP